MSQDRMTEADVRRTRLLAYLAAAVFAGCTILLFVLPLPTVVRAVGGGFNLVVAIGAIIYARGLRSVG